ncbi:MAG: hypothetical protein JST81_06010 [Bacteroidetes bacterium]|jgi:Skp family chaperone for outer membrane proteins|nr:hypothetical protein [Bacteroidota bacterium]
MKRMLLYFLFFISCFSAAKAQENPGGDEANKEQKIKALYIAYITQQLNLTESEAQKFWPLHAQFESEIKSVDIDLPELDRQQAMLNIKKKYQDRFTTILGATRSNNFYKLHGEFTKKLVDEIRKRRKNNMNQQRPGRRRNF